MTINYKNLVIRIELILVISVFLSLFLIDKGTISEYVLIILLFLILALIFIYLGTKAIMNAKTETLVTAYLFITRMCLIIPVSILTAFLLFQSVSLPYRNLHPYFFYIISITLILIYDTALLYYVRLSDEDK